MTDALVALESLLEELPGAVDRRKLGDRLSHSLEALRNADHQIARMNAVLDFAALTGFGGTAAERETLAELKEEACAVGEALETASTADQLRAAVFDY